MDLVERYLGAVRWNLPADRADDIVAELGDLIHARIEDREEALGRPLGKDEISQLLKEFGHPLAVSGQYHEQRALIGPEVFPFYWFALRVLLAVVGLIAAIQIGGRVIVGNEHISRALAHGISQAFEALLLHAAIVTLTNSGRLGNLVAASSGPVGRDEVSESVLPWTDPSARTWTTISEPRTRWSRHAGSCGSACVCSPSPGPALRWRRS